MPKYIDFGELKANTQIEDVIGLLQLTMTQQGNQWRGPCPACGSESDRALVVTPSKQAYFCFAAEEGGDVIAFVAHIRGTAMKAAADFIVDHLTTIDDPPPERVTKPESFEPLDYLVTDHEKLATLGLKPETCNHFGAGYAPKGILRGRLAIPIHDAEGVLIGYCGRAVTEEQQPNLIFPKGFNPDAYRFNLHRLEPGECHCLDDPLKAMLAYQNGVDNVIALLTESTTNVVSLPVQQRA